MPEPYMRGGGSETDGGRGREENGYKGGGDCMKGMEAGRRGRSAESEKIEKFASLQT